MPAPKKTNPLMELAVAEAEASPQPWREPEFVPWTSEKLGGQVVRGYAYAGGLLWWPADMKGAPVGAIPLFKRATDG